MTLFDLLFAGSFLASVVVFVVAVYAAIRRRGSLLRKLLIGWGVYAAIYLGTLVMVSLASPQRVMTVGEVRCWDDWCIAVANVQRTQTGVGYSYVLTLRLSSDAKRVTQRENDLAVYLIDDKGHRFDPNAVTSEIPFNVQLGPGESVETTRVLEVPAGARSLGLVFTHVGVGPGKFVIGDDESLFHKRTIVRID